MELSAIKVTGYDVKRGTLLQYMTKADLPSPFDVMSSNLTANKLIK